MSEMDAAKGWTFLTNHAHVLVCITRDPGIRVREIADQIGITERATQRIVADLARGGYVERARVGRRTTYTINGRLPLRHPLEEHREIGALLEALGARETRASEEADRDDPRRALGARSLSRVPPPTP